MGLDGLMTTLSEADLGMLWQGLQMTLAVTAWTLAIALPLGILLGVVRFLQLPVLSAAVGGCIDAIRSVPLVLFVVIIFLVLPMEAFSRAVFTLATFNAMYIAEIVRGGLLSVDRREMQAAEVLGLTLFQRIWKIALPQALTAMVPALINQASVVIKDTTLVSVGLLELTKAVQILNMRHVADTAWCLLLVAGVYFCFSYGICCLGQWVESRLRTRGTEMAPVKAFG
jgi:putative glutamine transport system permease protein